MCFVCLRIRTLSIGAIIEYDEKIAAELISHCLYMLIYLGIGSARPFLLRFAETRV